MFLKKYFKSITKGINIIKIFTLTLFLVQCMTIGPYYGPVTVVLNEKIDQSKYVRIAVMPFDTSAYKGFDENSGLTLADWYSAELLKIGYNVVERARVEKLLKEQELQISDMVDYDTAIRVGKILGVQAIVFGSSAGKPGQFTSIVKLVDVETGEIVWTLVLETNLPNNAVPKLKQALDEYYKKNK
jgi:PBP1b-binding outer membrane lipoprotein LpoB